MEKYTKKVDTPEQSKDNSYEDELRLTVNQDKLKNIIHEAPEILGRNEDYSDLKTMSSFKVGRFYWNRNKNFKEKEINFAFTPTVQEQTRWQNEAFPKLSSLLTYLKNKFGGLDRFEIIFFRYNKPRSYYFEKLNITTNVYVNLSSYLKYAEVINPEISQLKVSKYALKIRNEYSKKVPDAFFNNKPPSDLVAELKRSNYKVIENIIREYEKMPVDDKTNLKTILEHSQLGEDTIKEFSNLKPEAPAKQLKLFLKIKDELSQKEIDILVTRLLKSKSSLKFVKTMGELSSQEQKRIAQNLPEMVLMYDRYTQLEESMKLFKKKIKEHTQSKKQNEKDIHKFLTRHYWLLGIEYFDRRINSDFNFNGKRTSDTRIGNKHADFIILQRLDGIDKCVVIELEEANDKIFNKDGTISKKVYDGIIQAVDYSLEQKFRNIHSKGIAVIGSLKTSKLSKDEINRLHLLSESFPNVEVLTYDQIISKAETTLKFWKTYEHPSKFNK